MSSDAIWSLAKCKYRSTSLQERVCTSFRLFTYPSKIIKIDRSMNKQFFKNLSSTDKCILMWQIHSFTIFVTYITAVLLAHSAKKIFIFRAKLYKKCFWMCSFFSRSFFITWFIFIVEKGPFSTYKTSADDFKNI